MEGSEHLRVWGRVLQAEAETMQRCKGGCVLGLHRRGEEAEVQAGPLGHGDYSVHLGFYS